jgi:hypothetical protein
MRLVESAQAHRTGVAVLLYSTWFSHDEYVGV